MQFRGLTAMVAILWALGAGVAIPGCMPGGGARGATTKRSLVRCRKRLARQRSRGDRLRVRNAQLDGALRRAMELSASSRGRAARRRDQLRARVGRLRWFRRAACREVDIRLSEAVFHARVKELAHERLQKQLARARGKRRKRALQPRVAEAHRQRERWRARRERLRELQRRCRLHAATRALRPNPPPPPAPRAPGR